MLIPDLLNMLFDQSDYGALLVLRSIHRRKTVYANKYSLSRYYEFAYCERGIYFICKDGRIKVVKFVIDKVDIHMGDDNMLHWSLGHLELSKYLVAVGADIHAFNEYALRSCAEHGHMDVLKYLVSIGANVNFFDYIVFWGVFHNDLNVVKYLISVGTNINKRALEICVGRNYVEMLRCMVEYGANVHACDDYALRESARKGRIEMVKYLVGVGANIRADNDSALKWSKENGHMHVYEYLMSKINDNM